jgi:glucose-fructose oxidoreductase
LLTDSDVCQERFVMPRRRNSAPLTGKRGIVRYAVVGLGHIAQAAVLPAFGHASRNSRLAALVSGDSRKLEQLGRRYRVPHLCSYEAMDELFASGAVDAVYVALPNSEHRDCVVRAAQAGLDVLCEKPLAVTARECEAMIGAAKRARVKLMTAYRLHFERANLEVARLARSGKLGALRFFSSEFSMQVRPDNIRLERELGGGPLHDIGIYCINAARSVFAADPVEVWATATRSSDRRFREVDETVCAAMRFGDERLASFTCSFGAADRSVYTVTGTRGSVTLDPAYEYAQGLSYRARIGDRKTSRRFAKSDQFAAELLYFSDCILKKREPEPSGAEGLMDVRIIECMLRSVRNGRWVSVGARQRRRRPSMRQEIRRPPVPREPKLVKVESASQ